MVVLDTYWLVLASLALVTIFWLWAQSRRSYANFNVPPFPAQRWPFFGNFFLLFGDMHENMKAWKKKVGDIYSLDLVGQLHVMFNDFNDIKEVWVKHADKIINTQVSFGDELLDEYDSGIVGGRDENWKEQRATSLSILRSFGMGKNLMAEKILEEVAEITKKLSSFKGQPKEVSLLIDTAVANIISSVAVGKRFDYDDPEFDNLLNRTHTFIKHFGTMYMLTPLKQVYHLPGDVFHMKKWTKAAREITKYYTKPFLHQFQENFNANEEPHNFISAYLQEMAKKKEKLPSTHLDEKNLISIIRMLFSAGTDTTSTTILWCLIYMLHNPSIQEKVYREIEANVGTERLPNAADKPKLTYLNAVIYETQRIANTVPIGLRREVSETFEIHGLTIPKGSVVWPIMQSVHLDSKIWGDPENFRPERFIDENGSLINREELIPFNMGRRLCLGEGLAKMELFLFLSGMFQRFRFEPADTTGQLPPLKPIFGTTLLPLPFQLRFIERK